MANEILGQSKSTRTREVTLESIVANNFSLSRFSVFALTMSIFKAFGDIGSMGLPRRLDSSWHIEAEVQSHSVKRINENELQLLLPIPCLSTSTFYNSAMTPTTAASAATSSLPTALVEKISALLLNDVAEALGVATVAFAEEATVDTVLFVPIPVLNGALVTTGAELIDPVAVELPVDSGNAVVVREPDPEFPCSPVLTATVVLAPPLP